ncbi:MAG TPA: ABC transporter ATP-binding protein [Candidatus Bipolaricaulis anaerobius]|uniref:ABC transporter ATP-binding protein n=1 Tax=Candidatus Bipolaricaulis anaerobius TaxID=2026885 RepID=UPI001E2BA056|nr:ABC transporter ATP-binding protein [Candidatus Bipolaricaulis anaerobius]MDD5763632.1 ABC transporter ATP-binding protein [Candidatus Bipolaricaulis anaerobius]HNR24359.1 ABC transporter ATP-binding protein [Candidatus Bipolaricaulis anaerobius]HNS23558.1 ABC transporter ATP-binding protein [Candidatus Bipolaricaulis anaerobius]
MTKRFGGLVAVNEVTFEVAKGEILGIIGPNGAGKTTLINVISGLYLPDAGRILLDGRDITFTPPHVRCRLGIGRTFQLAYPLMDLSARENIMVGAVFGQPQRLREARHTADEIGQLLDLPAMDRGVWNLTALEIKKLELGRALATHPSVLFLDEGMAGLNQDETRAMIAVVRRIQEQGIGICVVEHVMSVIGELTDRVIVLNGGAVIAEGTYAEVCSDPEVIAAYLGKEE